MLRLICGPSGAGKTDALIREIRANIQEKERTYLLLPEQQAYISERDLPEKLPRNAGLFFEIVNFSSLADDVFHEYGGLTQDTQGAGVRALLMWNTLRTLSPLLLQYGKGAGSDITLSNLMLSTVGELRSGGIDAADLERAADELGKDSPLYKKLSDLALIDATYHHNLETAFGSDPSDRLFLMAKKLEEHDFFKGSHVYIDSFTDFTVPEYAVLRQILKQAKSVTIALCADSFRSGLVHFGAVVDTAKQLEKLSNEVGCRIEKHVLTVTDSKKSPSLSLLEAELWNFAHKKNDPSPADDGSVELFSTSNIYEECEAATLQVCKWVDEGMQYGDIAVVMRDAETYRGILDAALERHGIPYFFSERTDLSSKPVSRLILSALRAVSRGYRQSDIMTLLKTGLVGVELSDASMFEDYSDTWHISGKRFLDDAWSMNPDGLTTTRSARADAILDAANRVRKILIPPLEHLAANLRASKRVYDRCHALYDYLVRIELSKHLSERAMEELSRGEARSAGESLRLYCMLGEMLSTLCKLLPDEEMTVDELISALTLLLSNSDLGSIPDREDCVMIGSASTLRVENIRASILLGLCEGEFPRAVSDDGILTEGDKETLEAFGINLHSREHLRSSEELFYVYRAMTKPCEKLTLLTVAREIDGSAKTPSLAFVRASFLLGKHAKEFDLSEIRALYEESVPLPNSPILRVPSTQSPVTLSLSQSKIQAFVLCPYRYHSTYRLKLREQKDSTPTYADDGVFLHYVFEHFLRACLTDDGHLTLPSDNDVEALADRIIEAYLAQVCPIAPEAMDHRLLHLYTRLRKLSLLMLREIIFELRVGGFTPYKFEEAIGNRYGENGLPPLLLTLSDGSTVKLTGKIDRIDLFKTPDKTYVRVVDYKSGKHTFSLDEVRSGMDIQLVLYLFSVCTIDPSLTPAGAHYLFAASEKGVTEIKRSGFYLNDEEIRASYDGEDGERYTKKLLSQTQEEILDLEAQMKQAVSDIAMRILSGDAEKTPSEQACTFCPVRDHCAVAYHR